MPHRRGIMGPENSNILYWLLGFSYFLHLIAAMVGIWDRLRLKPGIIERLNAFVDIATFNVFKKDTSTQFAECARSKDLEQLINVTDKRFERMNESLKEQQRTNQHLYNELLRSISRLEGAFSRHESQAT